MVPLMGGVFFVAACAKPADRIRSQRINCGIIPNGVNSGGSQSAALPCREPRCSRLPCIVIALVRHFQGHGETTDEMVRHRSAHMLRFAGLALVPGSLL